MGTFSAIVTAAVCLPFVLYLLFSIPVLGDGGSAWKQIPEEVEWGVFVSAMLWSFTGWDRYVLLRLRRGEVTVVSQSSAGGWWVAHVSAALYVKHRPSHHCMACMWCFSLGTFAGEVKDPRKTYIRGSFLTLVYVLIVYISPLIAGIQTHPDLDDWVEGSFAKFANDVGPWLSYWITVASLASNFGLFSATLASASRAMAALSGDRAEATLKPLCRHLPKVLGWEWKARHTPVVCIVVMSVLSCTLSIVLDYSVIVESDVMLTVSGLCWQPMLAQAW